MKNIIEHDQNYSLKCPSQYVNPSSFDGLEQLESVIVIILKKYLDKYYKNVRNEWIKQNLEIVELTANMGNFEFSYQVKVYDNEFDLRDKIETLTQEHLDEFYKGLKSDVLKNVFVDRHLYLPLITLNVLQSGVIEVHPQGLNPGEQHFISDIKKYIDSHKESLNNSKIFVLRNLPKRGIGFFELTNYYPDFIVWFYNNGMQNILFVDPKGLGHMLDGFEAEEIILYKKIKELEARVIKLNNTTNVTLDSFIISVTPKQEADKIFQDRKALSYDDYLSYHVLFEEDPAHIEKMFNVIFKYNEKVN